MSTPETNRPDPDALLQSLKEREEAEQKGKLKIFFGMCAGVGKTYDMLKAAQDAQTHGIDVVIGYVETHRRPETEALLKGLVIIPRRRIEYKGAVLEEMDLDAILARKPALVLVDELAHTNAQGSRHTKRYMDVEEILDNGIDVFTTLNVQHLESRADTVAQITGAIVRETVPDSMIERADDVELIDIAPDELLTRLTEGKVYTPERSARAIQSFFRKGNLTALREMSLRITAERVDRQLLDYMRTKRIAGPWKSGQRLIVAVSPSPHSVKLIRWARRMAYTMDAPWIALYVESSKPLTEPAKAQLAQNIKLARELGAAIVSTADEDVVAAVLRVARQENASQILIGKSRAFHPFRKQLLDRLIERSGELDIYVIGGEEEEDVRRKRFSGLQIESGWRQYAIAAAAIVGVTLLCYPAATFLGYQTVSLVLLLTVALLPLKLGAGPVLAAAALSAVLWDFFFIPPQFTFAIGVVQDYLMLATYFAIATVTGVLTARIRAREQAVLQREAHATALYALTRDLSVAGSQDGVVRASLNNIARSFKADAVMFLSEADGDIFTAPHPASTLAVSEKELGVAAWVYWNERKAGRHTDTLPFAEGTYLPLSGPRYPLGVLGVRLPQGARMSLDQEILLENFARQISSSLEREALNELTKKSIAIEESERLYKTLFNSISHEMRTPLSAIIGASEGLMDEEVSRTMETRNALSGEIHVAALRLNRLVENLLDMTRIESGLIRPKLDWCDLHDLLHEPVRRLSQEIGQHPVVVEVPEGAPLVRLDFALIEQVLINLLHNALQYTPPTTPITLTAAVQESECIIEVTDRGPGLPAGEEEKVFEKFYRLPGSKAGGTGLGLSIARGFVQAHKGTIKASNAPGGGARFAVRLPINATPDKQSPSQ